MKKILIVLLIIWHSNAFATEFYVSTTGSNNNDGLSNSTPWRTISYAATRAKSGDTVWIKAGNYGDEHVVIKSKGKKGQPISFIGYKRTPGDISTMYYTYAKGKPMDKNEMPMLDGKDRASGLKGISLDKSRYIILKNIQVKNYRWGIHGGNTSNSIIERVLGISFGDVNSTAASGYGAQYGKGGNNIVKECIFINATGANLRLEGDKNIIDNVKSYADDNSTGEISATDYYIHINGGNNNIIKNCYVERVGNLKHKGHGIGLKYDCENNLIEDCEVVNVRGAIEFRHSGVKNNIARGVLIKGPEGSISLRDGANNNIIENSIIKNTNEGIRFYDQTEDGQGGVVASKNIIKNSIFYNIGTFVVSKKSKKVSKTGYISNNKIINCTVDRANDIFNGELPMDASNEIVNSIFNNIKKFERKNVKYTSKWKSINNNYFNNGFTPISGIGNISMNPQFEDVSKGNYRLKSSSKLIDAGKNINDVKKDFDGNPRPNGSSHDIGAFEYQDGSSASININAGEDVSICKGESVTLTASGGSFYEWSNGATTESITVNPEETQSYSVTIKEGNLITTKEVKVTVNNVTANAGEDVSIYEGDNIILTANGGDTYLWSNGETTESITVNPSKTIEYSVIVSKNGCDDTDYVEVQVIKNDITNPPPANANAGEDITICLGESIILRGSGGATYLWNNGETKKNIEINPTRTTTYTLEATRGGVSNRDAVTVTVENCKNDISSINKGKNLELYPNPTTGIVNINIKNFSKELNVDLINLNGSIIYSDKINSKQGRISKQIDLSKFAKGVYFVRVFNSDQNMIKKILMI